MREKLLKYILNLIVGKSVDEQEKDYISKYGYPKESKVFVDKRGRCSQIVGSETLLKNADILNKIFKTKNGERKIQKDT